MKKKMLKFSSIKAFFILGIMCCFCSCNQHIPNNSNELNGEIVTTKSGLKIKLEWQQGWGESWRFLEEVKMINGKDTTVKWIYVSERTFLK